VALNAQQLAFCLYVAAGCSGTDAAKRAGYGAKSAHVTASLFLKREDIQAEIGRQRVHQRNPQPKGKVVALRNSTARSRGGDGGSRSGGGLPPLDGDVLPPGGPHGDDRGGKYPPGTDPLELCDDYVIHRLMLNLEQCLGRIPIVVTRIAKLIENGREVMEATEVSMRSVDAAGANKALALLQDELRRREDKAGASAGAGGERPGQVTQEYRDRLLAGGKLRQAV
jgi:hypothetical protein